MKNIKDCRADIIDPVTFQDATNLTTDVIASNLEFDCGERGIPVKITVEEIKSGGLLGSKNPCITVSHPNPPQKYYDQVIIINGNSLVFKFWGYSKAYDGYINKKKKKFELAFQAEATWHSSIIEAVKSRFIN